MSDETLTINSEEERLDAINAVDDQDPDALEKLQKIQDLEITEPEAAPEGDTPVKEEVVEEAPEVVEEKPVEEKAEVPPEEEGNLLTIKPEDLPDGYDTPGKAFKTLEHQKAHIKKMDEQMEAMRQKLESQTPVEPEPVQTEVQPEPDSYDNQIKDIETKLAKQYEEDPLSPEVAKMQREIVTVERQRLRSEIAASKEEVRKEANNQFEQYKQSKEQERIDKLNTEAREKNYQEFDELGKEKEYSEYKMDKPAKEVEKDFLMLRGEIEKAYYGRPAQTWAESNNALTQYNNKAPSIMTKLQALNIPTEYPKDVTTYLELYKVLNDRDGIRFNENGEQVIHRKRWDVSRGEEVADTFPNLKATIEHQRVTSGHYKKKELSAYDKGSTDALNAQGKRDHNELESDDGRQEAGKSTYQELLAELDKLPNTAASLERTMQINKQLEEMEKTT